MCHDTGKAQESETPDTLERGKNSGSENRTVRIIIKGADRCSDTVSECYVASIYLAGRVPKVYTLENLNTRGFGPKDTQQWDKARVKVCILKGATSQPTIPIHFPEHRQPG